MKTIHVIAFVLLVIGGLNLGLTAFGWDVIGSLGSAVASVIYVLVGLSALYLAFTHGKDCKKCMKGGAPLGA